MKATAHNEASMNLATSSKNASSGRSMLYPLPQQHTPSVIANHGQSSFSYGMFMSPASKQYQELQFQHLLAARAARVRAAIAENPPSSAPSNRDPPGMVMSSPHGLELLREASLQVPSTFDSIVTTKTAIKPASTNPTTTNLSAKSVNKPVALPKNLKNLSSGDRMKKPVIIPEERKRLPNRQKNMVPDYDKVVWVEDVRDNDIICGRGGRSNNHVGNKKYRQVVAEMKKAYRGTDSRKDKTKLSRAIVTHIQSPEYGGRFIKMDPISGRYYQVDNVEARMKTSQALRETKILKWTV